MHENTAMLLPTVFYRTLYRQISIFVRVRVIKKRLLLSGVIAEGTQGTRTPTILRWGTVFPVFLTIKSESS